MPFMLMVAIFATLILNVGEWIWAAHLQGENQTLSESTQDGPDQYFGVSSL
jgi:hypothetical protein